VKPHDFAIVGAGIAGASLAAELAPHASVLLLEAEDAPGYHATGRSAAFWEECYGGPEIVPLTLASGPYLREHGFVSRRGALYIGRDSEAGLLDAFEARFGGTGATFERLDRERVAAIVPGLRPSWTGAIWAPTSTSRGCTSITSAWRSATASSWQCVPASRRFTGMPGSGESGAKTTAALPHRRS